MAPPGKSQQRVFAYLINHIFQFLNK